jgi:hypothetical protein
MPYPERCIRGVRAQDHVSEEGLLLGPGMRFEPNAKRTDGKLEVSINWEDEPDTAAKNLEERKKDNPEVFEFKIGIAIIATKELDDLCRRVKVRELLSYERAPEDDNLQHGNILISGRSDKKVRVHFQERVAGLATVIKRTNNPFPVASPDAVPGKIDF